MLVEVHVDNFSRKTVPAKRLQCDCSTVLAGKISTALSLYTICICRINIPPVVCGLVKPIVQNCSRIQNQHLCSRFALLTIYIYIYSFQVWDRFEWVWCRNGNWARAIAPIVRTWFARRFERKIVLGWTSETQIPTLHVIDIGGALNFSKIRSKIYNSIFFSQMF